MVEPGVMVLPGSCCHSGVPVAASITLPVNVPRVGLLAGPATAAATPLAVGTGASAPAGRIFGENCTGAGGGWTAALDPPNQPNW